ncbi:MAG: YbhB/YbcL family Raf kinase inhibitor-like protein [Armatimonadota bacterium]
MLEIQSPAFSDDGPIPRAHTCDGADISPPLAWSGMPSDAKALALIVDDPDAPAGTWVHWVLYDLPPAVDNLPSGLPTDPQISQPVQARQGTNDFQRSGYGGPCPPPGPAHRYFFKLYALDQELDLPPGATKAILAKAMEGHVLAEALLIGKYGR